MITVRKLKLTIMNEDENSRKEQYKFIRESQYAQYQGLNLAMGIITSAYLQSDRDIKNDIFKDAQKSLKNTNPLFDNIEFGKGRDKKLSNLNKLSSRERNFAKTYNHSISKRIIEFSKKHKCETIHLEKLTKEGFSNLILSNWSYYELQNMIEYKAKREGINIKYVDPSYTFQTCSKCGNIDKENRQTQEQFKCKKCKFELNADHNASINIARSKDFKK